MNRRVALATTAALPLAGAGFAFSADEFQANATDALWRELIAAEADLRPRTPPWLPPRTPHGPAAAVPDRSASARSGASRAA